MSRFTHTLLSTLQNWTVTHRFVSGNRRCWETRPYFGSGKRFEATTRRSTSETDHLATSGCTKANGSFDQDSSKRDPHRKGFQKRRCSRLARSKGRLPAVPPPSSIFGLARHLRRRANLRWRLHHLHYDPDGYGIPESTRLAAVRVVSDSRRTTS